MHHPLAFIALVLGAAARLTAQPLPLMPLSPGAARTVEDPMIGKAREAAGDFAKALPDFVCREVMSRFESNQTLHANQAPTVWLPADVVTAEVVYESGKEDYRHVTINSKPVNKRMEQLQGAWSTGEFGSILSQIFSPSTAADFRFRKDSTIAGKHVKTFSFEVARVNSQWMIEVAGQSVQPAFGGAVWIESQTARVLRVEMQAHELPERFPAGRVESTTDYEYVQIGADKYLLPSHCETLTCDQGPLHCARNVIYFVDYHKYTSDSSIHFGTGKQ